MSQDDIQMSSKQADSTECGKRDANVGYCRPPEHSRFWPGQSGNPLGRPKNNLSFASELADELCGSIADSDGGRITKKRAIVKTLVEAAIRGNVKVAIALMGLCAKSQSHDSDPGAADDDAFVEKLAAGEQQSTAGIGTCISTPNEETEK